MIEQSAIWSHSDFAFQVARLTGVYTSESRAHGGALLEQAARDCEQDEVRLAGEPLLDLDHGCVMTNLSRCDTLSSCVILLGDKTLFLLRLACGR